MSVLAITFEYQIERNMTTKHVEAQYLSIGDKLQSGGVVTHRPSVGIKTPRGKVDLGIDGFRKTWNKTTEIAIITE
jgi:hypothetical protein